MIDFSKPLRTVFKHYPVTCIKVLKGAKFPYICVVQKEDIEECYHFASNGLIHGGGLEVENTPEPAIEKTMMNEVKITLTDRENDIIGRRMAELDLTEAQFFLLSARFYDKYLSSADYVREAIDQLLDIDNPRKKFTPPEDTYVAGDINQYLKYFFADVLNWLQWYGPWARIRTDAGHNNVNIEITKEV